VNGGAEVLIGKVDLTIEGVRAQALLLVDLDDVYYIVDHTLTFIDNHPEVVQQLGSTLQTTVGAVGGLVGGVVRGLLLGTTRLASGETLQRLVDEVTPGLSRSYAVPTPAPPAGEALALECWVAEEATRRRSRAGTTRRGGWRFVSSPTARIPSGGCGM
jgi:hypothetical protein